MAHDGKVMWWGRGDDGKAERDDLGPWIAVSGRAPKWNAEAEAEIARLHEAREVVSAENYRLRAAITDAASALESVARVLRKAVAERGEGEE